MWSTARCGAAVDPLTSKCAGGVRWPLDRGPGADGQAVTYGIRPEHLTLAAPGGIAVPGEIIVVEPTGAETEFLIKVGDAQFDLRTHGRPRVNPGDKVGLAIDPANVHVFDQATGQRCGVRLAAGSRARSAWHDPVAGRSRLGWRTRQCARHSPRIRNLDRLR